MKVYVYIFLCVLVWPCVLQNVPLARNLLQLSEKEEKEKQES